MQPPTFVRRCYLEQHRRFEFTNFGKSIVDLWFVSRPCLRVQDYETLFKVNVKLRAYEEGVQEAAQGGLLVGFVADHCDHRDDRAAAALPPIATERWNVLQAVFFASTVLTTIGSNLFFEVYREDGTYMSCFF